MTLALLSVIALTAMPLAEISSMRMKEHELRQSLRLIRTALDQYKAASDSGVIPKKAGESGYPPNLDVLTAPIASSKEIVQVPLIFLRSMPRDPFNTDPSLPAANTWALRSYGKVGEIGLDVFDIHSQSTRQGLNGIRHDQW